MQAMIPMMDKLTLADLMESAIAELPRSQEQAAIEGNDYWHGRLCDLEDDATWTLECLLDETISVADAIEWCERNNLIAD